MRNWFVKVRSEGIKFPTKITLQFQRLSSNESMKSAEKLASLGEYNNNLPRGFNGMLKLTYVFPVLIPCVYCRMKKAFHNAQ